MQNRQPDIFISYARDNDATEARWVSTFEEHLQALVREKLGRNDLFVLFDVRDVSATGDPMTYLRAQAAQARVFVAIASRSYLASAPCAEELRSFRATGNPNLFVVRYQNLDAGVLEASGLVGNGNDFFENLPHLHARTMQERESLGMPLEPVSPSYRERLHTLAEAIAARLIQAPEAPPSNARDGGVAVRVFLAEVAGQNTYRRKYLRRALQDAQEHGAPMQIVDDPRDQASCELAVHLLGAEDDEIVVGQLERTLAARRPAFLWCAQAALDAPAADPTRRSRLQELKEGSALRSYRLYVTANERDLVKPIVSCVHELGRERRKRLCISAYDEDLDKAHLIQWLEHLERHRIEALDLLHPREYSRKFHDDFRTALSQCPAVLFIQGTQPTDADQDARIDEWLKTRLAAISVTAERSESRRGQELGVCLAPPAREGRAPRAINVLGIPVQPIWVEQQQGFDTTKADRFLAEIGFLKPAGDGTPPQGA